MTPKQDNYIDIHFTGEKQDSAHTEGSKLAYFHNEKGDCTITLDEEPIAICGDDVSATKLINAFRSKTLRISVLEKLAGNPLPTEGQTTEQWRLSKAYAETSKLINGYHQSFAMERALGFNTSADLQQSIAHKQLINASDVKYVMHWLIQNGFDVIKESEVSEGQSETQELRKEIEALKQALRECKEELHPTQFFGLRLKIENLLK